MSVEIERERDGSASPRWRNLFPIAPGSDGWQNGDRERQLATGKYQFPSGQNHFTVLHFFFLPVFQKQQLYSLWCTFGVGPPLKGKREKRERGLDGRDFFWMSYAKISQPLSVDLTWAMASADLMQNPTPEECESELAAYLPHRACQRERASNPRRSLPIQRHRFLSRKAESPLTDPPRSWGPRHEQLADLVIYLLFSLVAVANMAWA